MKRHISLLVAVVMVLTLIYTPAGLVYAADKDAVGNENKEVTEPVEKEVTEPAKEEVTEPAKEEVTEPAEEEVDPKSNSADESKAKSLTVEGTGTGGNTTGDQDSLENGDGNDTPDTPEVAEIVNLKVTSQKATTIGLKWDAFKDADSNPADSYKVFLGEKDVTPTDLKTGAETITGTIKSLKPKTPYTFTVRAYKSDTENPVAEGTIDSYTIPKKPAAPAKLTASIVYTDKGKDKGYYLKYKLTSSKVSGITGYRFQYTINGTTYKKDVTANSYVVPKILKNKNKQNFYVFAYDTYKGKKYFSASTKCSITAATTRWRAVVPSGKKYGKKYYYVNGVMQKNKEFWLGKLKYYVDKNGVWRGGSKYMWGRCKKQTSGTDTMLVTSRNRHTVCIFKKIDGTWCCQYEWLCSVGKKGSKTPHGKFYVRSKKKSFGKGHTCWYATRYHKKYPKAAFHSVLYKKGSKTKIKDGRLGKNISNGCVRLSLKWAKWIYDNVKKRSRILIY